MNLFDTRIFMKQESFDSEVLRYCETEVFGRNFVILNLPFTHIIFGYQNLSEKEVFPYEVSHCTESKN